MHYPESKFGGFTDIDGTIAFYNRVNALLKSSSVVLDIGCGTGSFARDSICLRKNLRILKGKCQKVIGIDVDKAAQENPFLDEFRSIIKNDLWPVDTKSVDLCVCDGVLEHMEEPDLFFSECARVLKTDGYLCIRTTNLFSYLGLISKIVPYNRHFSVISKVQSAHRDSKDVFPVFYRCNTIWSIARALRKHGFEFTVYGYEAEPSYLSFLHLFYFFGVLHQRFAPNAIKVGIFAFGKKL
jgi:SAM-dependent methyltransferase